MRIRELSLEELKEQEKQFEEQDVSQSQKIRLYKELHRRIRQSESETDGDRDILERVTEKLVFNLVHYGTYLKAHERKDDNQTISVLREALCYDKKNPIASYRLGFLTYRNKRYTEAQLYFQRAMSNHRLNPDSAYALTAAQLVNAQLYLTNSALHIAKAAYEEMEKLPEKAQAALPGYAFAELYESLAENDRYLERNAFFAVMPEGTERWSKEECEELTDDPPFNTIVLYFNDRNIRLVFNEEETVIASPAQGKILRSLLTESAEHKPTTRFTLRNCFENGMIEDVKKETFRKAVQRLRRKMKNCRVPAMINTTEYHGEAAYYYNGKIPFTIMYRVDE